MKMIEKVARAIRDSFNSNDIDCYPLARAALEAMLEPTDEMMKFYCCQSCNPNFEQNFKTAIQAALDEK